MTPVTPLFITSYSGRFTPGLYFDKPTLGNAPNIAAANWPANGRASYIPLGLTFNYHALRVFWYNGTTVVVSSGIDIGIYRADGTKLFSTGTTAQSGASASQYVGVDWLIPAGAYYLAMSVAWTGGTTPTLHTTQSVNVNQQKMCGCLEEAAASPLPSSMTPVTLTSQHWPLFGITKTTSGY